MCIKKFISFFFSAYGSYRASSVSKIISEIAGLHTAAIPHAGAAGASVTVLPAALSESAPSRSVSHSAPSSGAASAPSNKKGDISDTSKEEDVKDSSNRTQTVKKYNLNPKFNKS